MTAILSQLRVHRTGPGPHRGVLEASGAIFRCALGRTGVATLKREGDGATPRGAWPLRRLYYRPDRMARPRCGLPVAAIDPGLGWCEDPASFAYNRPVRLPFAHGRETMWRDDALYDLVIVVGHNDQPPLKPFGSAIFMHLAREGFRPTAGCVALARADLVRLLPRLGPETRLVVG